MRISHIAMYVQDLEVVKEFYIRFFGAKAGELYHNPKTGLKSYFLSFDEGTRLELMNLPEMQDQKKVLVRMGYIAGDGYYESTVLGPEDNQIEITE